MCIAIKNILARLQFVVYYPWRKDKPVNDQTNDPTANAQIPGNQAVTDPPSVRTDQSQDATAGTGLAGAYAPDVPAAPEVPADVEKWFTETKAAGHAILDKIHNSMSLLDSKNYVAEARAWIEKLFDEAKNGPPSKQ